MLFNRLRILLILLLAAVYTGLTAAYAPTTTQGRSPAPLPGFLAPSFELRSLRGETIPFGSSNNRATIINLWASWCLPCRTEMPALQRVYEEYHDQGVQVLAVNMTAQDDASAVSLFIEDYQLTMPVLLDTEGTVSRAYQMRALPTTFFVDQDGVIRDVVVGGPIPEALLRARLIEMLED